MPHSQKSKLPHSREFGYQKKGWLKELKDEFPSYNPKVKNGIVRGRT